MLKLLMGILQGANHGTEVVERFSDRGSVFTGTKRVLAVAMRLAHPSQAAVLSPAVDASTTHVDAYLQQKSPGTVVWQPLGFYSKRLDKAQIKYSAIDQELLVCYLGIRHFHHLLEGRQFVI